MLVLEQLCRAIDEKRNLDYEVTTAHMGGRCSCLLEDCSHEPPPALFIEKPGFPVRFLLTQEFLEQGEIGELYFLALEPLAGYPIAQQLHKEAVTAERVGGRPSGWGPFFLEIAGELSQVEQRRFLGSHDFDEESLKSPLLNRIYEYLARFEYFYNGNLAKFTLETLEAEERAQKDIENPL